MNLSDACGCHACTKAFHAKREAEGAERVEVLMILGGRMIVCAECGNKRCPHATNHLYACTRSNEPGQPGSRYA